MTNKSVAPQRPRALAERAMFDAWAEKDGMGGKFRESMYAAWEARAALAPSRGNESTNQNAVAWIHEEEASRVISAAQKDQAIRDGGASASSVRPYSIAAVLAVPLPAAFALDPHPPHRDCTCAACRPSFDNGADDPAQRYDIARGVMLGKPEWMAEAKRLVFRLMQSANGDGAGHTPQVSVVDAKASLLDHIRTHPAQRGGNG